MSEEKIEITLTGNQAIDYIANVAANAVNKESKERESKFFRNLGIALTIFGLVGFGALYKVIDISVEDSVDNKVRIIEENVKSTLAERNIELKNIASLQRMALRATIFQNKEDVDKKEFDIFSSSVFDAIETKPKITSDPLFELILTSMVSQAVNKDEYQTLEKLDSKIRDKLRGVDRIVHDLSGYFTYRLVTEPISPFELKEDFKLASFYIDELPKVGFPESYMFNRMIINHVGEKPLEVKAQINQLPKLSDFDREWFFKNMDELINEQNAEGRYLDYLEIVKEMYNKYKMDFDIHRPSTN
ncbi:hypothetical protein P886_4699 [Alteromonadaceae bacterium 2753L.S.0a.02]|nr:hypothetical protein P886_4699 [Alteromonadaceae bacterium 2753L.S.0a.02]